METKRAEIQIADFIRGVLPGEENVVELSTKILGDGDVR